MELRQLEYFCTVGTLENFTRAAQILHVSQPSVTKAIKALESELQLTLIDRSQKHISLTEAGQVFFQHAKKIMQDVEEAQHSLQRFQSPRGNIIHFGLPPMVEAYLFPDFFIKFQATHPKIALDIQECNDSGEVLQKLDNGILDFGIIFTSTGENFDYSLSLLSDEFNLCLPKNHRLVNRDMVSFNELRSEKFILQQAGTYQYQKIFERCAQSGYSPDVLLCTSQLKTIKQLVTNGAGISLLPSFVIRSNGDFCHRKISPPVSFNVTLAWSKYKPLSIVSSRFVDFIRTSFNTQSR